MRKPQSSSLAHVLILTWSVFAFCSPSALIEVTLFPAGDFKGTTTKIEGFAVQRNNEIVADGVRVDLRELKTGIQLRDTHTQRQLNTQIFPYAKLLHAHGTAGRGEADIEIRGVKKHISGTYAKKDNEITATFPIQLSDFGIKNIKYMGVGVEDSAKITVTIPLKLSKP